jgi:hypothetical protein
MHVLRVAFMVMGISLVWWLVSRRRRVGVSEGPVPTVRYIPVLRSDGRTAIWRTVRRPENLQPTLEEQFRYFVFRLHPDYHLDWSEPPWFSPAERLPDGHYQGYVLVRFRKLSG